MSIEDFINLAHPTVYDAARAATDWLDRHNGRTGEEQTLRILKVGEEYGEAIAAWIGCTGQNPRKGVTHTRDDVAAELADVVLAALTAMDSIGADPETVMDAAVARVWGRFGQVPA